MTNPIKLWDKVYTFTKNDKSPIWHRKVVSITETEQWKTVQVDPLYDPDYHSKEETILYDYSDCFVDKTKFVEYLIKCRNSDIESYTLHVNKIYNGFLTQRPIC